MGVTIYNPKGMKAKHPITILDARALGLYSVDSFQTARIPFESLIARPDVESTSVTEATHEGRPCQKVTYRRKDGCNVEVWIDTDRGPSVLRSITECVSKVATVSEEIVSHVEQHEPSGYWFPTRIQYWYRTNGKVTGTEDLSIKVVSMGTSLPPETFTFAGLGVEPGREVGPVGFENPLQRLWTGEKLVYYDGSPIEPMERSSWWVWVVGIGAVVVGAVVLLAWYRGRIRSV